jgi:hypothetical protein
MKILCSNYLSLLNKIRTLNLLHQSNQSHAALPKNAGRAFLHLTQLLPVQKIVQTQNRNRIRRDRFPAA